MPPMRHRRSQSGLTALSTSLPGTVSPIWLALLFQCSETTGFVKLKIYTFGSFEDRGIVAGECTSRVAEHAVWDVL